MTAIAYCSPCGRRRDLGELLRVINRAEPSRTFYVCRPTRDGRCLQGALDASRTRIELADPEAAALFDRAYAPREEAAS